MVARVILATVLLAQLGDAATFTVGEALHGIDLESNGIAVAAYHWGGAAGVLALKGAALIFALAAILIGAERYPRVLLWGGAATAGMGLVGVTANVTSLLLLAG